MTDNVLVAKLIVECAHPDALLHLENCKWTVVAGGRTLCDPCETAEDAVLEAAAGLAGSIIPDKQQTEEGGLARATTH